MQVIPFVKAALVTGVSAGVGDSMFQWARGMKFSRVKRKGRMDSWDAMRSTKVAIVAAAAGPILLIPSSLVNGGLEELLPSLLSAGVVELSMIPLFYAWKEDLLFSYKSNIARLVVIGSTYTMGLCVAISYPLGHFTQLANLGQLGVIYPEGIVWTAGVGLTSYFLYSFSHQTALSMETKMNKDKDFLITRAKLVGLLSSASMLGVSLFTIEEYPFAHLFLTDVTCMSAMVYQCFLTYIQSLEAERSKVQPGKEDTYATTYLRLRTLLNVGMVSSLLVGRPFASSGQQPVAVGLQCMAAFCWLCYFMTFDKEYEELDGDAGDWGLVSTDDEERAKARKEKAKKEKAAKRREEREQHRREREQKRAMLLAECGSKEETNSSPSSASSDSESETEPEQKVKANKSRATAAERHRSKAKAARAAKASITKASKKEEMEASEDEEVEVVPAKKSSKKVSIAPVTGVPVMAAPQKKEVAPSFEKSASAAPQVPVTVVAMAPFVEVETPETVVPEQSPAPEVSAPSTEVVEVAPVEAKAEAAVMAEPQAHAEE